MLQVHQLNTEGVEIQQSCWTGLFGGSMLHKRVECKYRHKDTSWFESQSGRAKREPRAWGKVKTEDSGGVMDLKNALLMLKEILN